MALLGGRDTRDLVVNTGVDATELRKFQLADGTTFDAVVGELEGALTAFNASISADPLMRYCYITDQPEVTYRMGTNPAFGDYDEYTRPDPNRGESDGHMLPIRPYDFMLRWTWDYMRKASRSQIEADIQVAIGASKDLVRQKILNRLLKRGDDSGKANGLGTGGYSAGFATAAANTSVDFAPPAYGGTTFDTSHNHMTAAATSLTQATVLANMKLVREHGHTGPFDLIISETDEATFRAFTDFVAAGDPFVQYANSVSLAAPALGEGYIGYIKDSLTRVRVQPGYPANYFTVLKSYGVNSQLNPLRIRVSKGMGQLGFTAFPDPRAGGISPANPLGNLMLWTEFGVGVGDRTAGSTNRSNASWADGTAA